MRFATILALAACLQACAARAPDPASDGKAVQSDALCFNDCLGAGGTREFCRSRCEY